MDHIVKTVQLLAPTPVQGKAVVSNAPAAETSKSFKRVKDSAVKELEGQPFNESKADTEKDLPDLEALPLWGMLLSSSVPVNTEADAEGEEIQLTRSSANEAGHGSHDIVGILEGIGLLNASEEGTTVDQSFGDPGLMQEFEVSSYQQETVSDLPVNSGKDSLENISGSTPEVEGTEQPQSPILPSAESTGNSSENKLFKGVYEAIERLSKQPEQAGNDEPVSVGNSYFEQKTSFFDQVADAKPLEDAVPAAVQESDMAENISNIVERMQAVISEDQQEFTVQLKPEFLGKISVKVVMDAEGVHAQIKAADPSSKGLIQSHLPALEESMRSVGLDVRNIEVTYEAASFGFDGKQQQGSQFSSSKQKHHRSLDGIAFEAEPNSFFEMMGTGEYLIQTDNSMDFEA